MAGSFGFEAEHYELCMRIGGMRLFPAVRQEPAATLIAATGVSCRQQIAHGTGRPGAPPGAARQRGTHRLRERVDVNQEVISILVLVAIFAIGTLRPINMGLLGITAAFIVGTAVGVSEDDIFAGFPGDLFIILVGVTYLFAIANNNGTVDWLVHAAVRAVQRPRGADPVGDVRDHGGADRGRLGRARRRWRSSRRSRSASPVRYKINPFMMGLMVVNGATAGGFSPISIFGSIVNGVVEQQQPRRQPDAAVLLVADLQHAAQRRRLLRVRRARPAQPPRRPRARGDRALQARDDRERRSRRSPAAPSTSTAEAPELNRDRILTLLGIAALVTLALMPGIDWDVGFVAVTIAVVLSLADAARHQGRGREGRVADRAADLRHRHVRRAAGGDRHDRVARREGRRASARRCSPRC